VWMSPLLCLAHAASVTTRIRLATGLLILPYYHPVTLAREIQTLWHLSGGRFVLGVGPGWDRHEFESLGMRLGERGRRTDEMITALRMLLTRRDVSFAGRYYRFERVSIEPLLPRFPELWAGGGSKIQTGLSPDKPYIAPAVLARIASADGWLARAAGSPDGQGRRPGDSCVPATDRTRPGHVTLWPPELRSPREHDRP